MEKFLYPTHPLRCVLTGHSECGKSVFLTNLILNFFNEFDKNIHLFTQSISRFIPKKLINCFSNYIPIHIIPNNVIENAFDIANEERVKKRF